MEKIRENEKMSTKFLEISVQMTERIFENFPLTLAKSVRRRQTPRFSNESSLAIIRFVIFGHGERGRTFERMGVDAWKKICYHSGGFNLYSLV